MHTDRIGNGADTAPRAMAMAALLVLLAGLTVWLGLGTLREVLMRWDLGGSASPYFLPGHALSLYVVTPLVTLASAFLFLAPGLILSAVFGREKHAAAWIVSGLAATLVIHIAATTVFQLATGVILKGLPYLSFVVALSVAALLIAGLRLSQGHANRLNLERSGRDLWIGAVLFLLCLILFAPKFYWENFTGDGSGSLQFARLYINELWPFWSREAGPISKAPSITMVLFVFPESWFLRLFGEWEFSVRAPLLMYLGLLYPVLAQLIRTGREHLPELRATDVALIIGALLLYVLSTVYSGGYHVYFGDSPMPAARETLAMICFMGFVLFFIEDRRALMVVAGILCHLVIPTGVLWLVMWPAAVFLVWRPMPWARLFWAAGIVVGAVLISILVPVIARQFGLPVTGDEFGADSITARLRYISFFDFGRFAFWAVPLGILPAVFLLTWRSQDKVSRALTLLTLAYFFFFYFQAYRVLLHHFIPAMIPPLVIMWRSPLMQDARWGGSLRGLAAVLLVVSTWLSWPEMKMHTFERTIGQYVATEGPVFEIAQPGDGDRFPGFSEKSLDIAHVLLGKLFPMTYGEDDPKTRYYGAPLVWWFYSYEPRPEGVEPNYILQPLDGAAPEDGEPLATEQGYGLFVRDRALYADHGATRLPVDTGAAIYVTPRTVIYGAGDTPLDGRVVVNISKQIKRLLGRN